MAIKITSEKVQQIADTIFGINAIARQLPGYEDENFKLTTASGDSFILKVSQPEESIDSLEFQDDLLEYVGTKKLAVNLPKVIPNIQGDRVSTITSEGKKRNVRLLSWVNGRLWVKVNPKTKKLRYHLGKQAGTLTIAMLDFKHSNAHREFDWDLANAGWTYKYLHLFSSEEKVFISQFQELYRQIQDIYQSLPKSIVHNDINDYNILVSKNVEDPQVSGIIDFGDAMYTQTVNDLAIVLAYAIMEVPDPLEAALDVLKGYHKQYRFNEDELKCLYALTAIRWVISVTKATIYKVEDPSSAYHVISEKPSWNALKRWSKIDPEFAERSFRNACGFDPHPS
ncbi:MAG: phosphotransferase [Bacteroidetes bacterium]|nr:phosphotransferase [Bacteroidota bacterium]